MKQNLETIDYKWLTHPTGDPFADAGGFAIEYLLKRLDEENKEKDIMSLIKEVANIYIKRWNAGLHMFFLNSTITQSAKGFQTHEEKLLKTENYFKSLLNGTANYNEGTCRITGKRTRLFKAGRENSILTGSGTFLNFHHAMEAGVLLSKEAIIRFFFVPIASVMVYDKMSIIHSNQKELVKYFVFKNVSENIKNSLFKFALRSKHQNPTTALFAYVDEILTKVPLATDETKKLSLALYHFSNFGTSPTIDIYKIPAKLFDFYRVCRRQTFIDDWQKFINSNYIKYIGYKPSYDPNTGLYNEKVKEITMIKSDVFKKLENNGALNFALCQFGERIDIKTNASYTIVNTDELENWKKNKVYQEWRKTHKADSEEFSKATRKLKEERILTYNLEDFSCKWINKVYDNLINGKSIRSLILKWNIENPFDFKITRNYQIIIRGMNTKTLDLIEKITDYLIGDESDLKKKKRALQTSNHSELRSFLIRQIEKNYKEGRDEPLITLRDYVGYLFPQGTNWTEIRDLMLICFYQKLHEKGIKMETGDDDSPSLETNEFTNSNNE